MRHRHPMRTSVPLFCRWQSLLRRKHDACHLWWKLTFYVYFYKNCCCCCCWRKWEIHSFYFLCSRWLFTSKHLGIYFRQAIDEAFKLSRLCVKRLQTLLSWRQQWNRHLTSYISKSFVVGILNLDAVSADWQCEDESQLTNSTVTTKAVMSQREVCLPKAGKKNKNTTGTQRRHNAACVSYVNAHQYSWWFKLFYGFILTKWHLCPWIQTFMR